MEVLLIIFFQNAEVERGTTDADEEKDDDNESYSDSF